MIGVGACRRVRAADFGTRAAVCVGSIAACLFLAGCGTWGTSYLVASNRLAIVSEAAEEYAQDLRWGRLKEAAAQIAPEHRVAFLELFEDAQEPFQFTSFEVISVDLTEERGRVEVTATFDLYRPPSISERTVREQQTWRYDRPSGRWLVEPDLSVFSAKPSGVSAGSN